MKLQDMKLHITNLYIAVILRLKIRSSEYISLCDLIACMDGTTETVAVFYLESILSVINF